MRFLQSIDTILQQLGLGFIKLYQITLSPDKGIPSLRLKGRICMHEPHCSEYGKLCLQRYGFFHSIGKITSRVFSCTGGMHKIYDPEFYKVVFFSSAPIGVPFLEKLSEDKRFEVTGVVTMPDAPAGRGMKMQENVVKAKGKELLRKNKIRYFFLKESFQNNREKTLEQKNIVRIPHENRGVIAYGDEYTHEQYIKLFQSLLVDGPWYFDTQGTKNCIVYKDAIFDLDKGESEQAKVYGKSIGIPEKQLDRHSKKRKIILLHGFAGKNYGGRKDELKQRCKQNNIAFFAPELVSNIKPNLAKQLQQLTKLYGDLIDENTTIIGHSLGAPLAAHFINTMNKKIDQLIYVAPANPTQDFAAIKDTIVALNEKGLRNFVDETIDYKKITQLTNQYAIYLSDDDPYIPYTKTFAYLQKNAPTATITTHHKYKHFSSDSLEKFPALLQTLTANSQDLKAAPYDDTFIQTPNSLRLDSKKYADEAKQFQQWLTEKKPDFLVVIAYGKIIPQHILDIPIFGPINVHGSILPKYRGASPIQSVFLHDEKETGITLIKMDAGLDTGDMIDIARFPIPFDWTAKDVIAKMQHIGPQFLVDTLRKYGKGLLGEVKQDDTHATHCGKIEKEDGLIDPYNDTIASIYNKYRAYILWPKIHWMHGDKRVIVEQLVLDEELFEEHKDTPLIINNTPNHCIKTLIVKPEGSKPQSWQDFVKGYIK